MAGLILTDDDFTGLGNGVTIAGRVPPVSDTGAAYVVDPNNAGVTGDGAGNIKFAVSAAAAKVRCGVNGAIQVRINDNAANEAFTIFVRDDANTPFPRNGYMLRVSTRFSGAVGQFSAISSSNYTASYIQPYQQVPWTFDPSGINVVALEAINNNMRIIINNVVAGSFTDSLHPATDSFNSKVGVVFNSDGPSILLVDRFTFYDSILVTESSEFPVVRFA